MEESHEYLKKITTGAGLVFIGLLISKLFGYFYRVVVARMGTEQYGTLSLSIAVFGILSMISLVGINEGIVRYVSYYQGKGDEKKLKEIYYSALKIGIPLSILFGIFLFIFSKDIALGIFKDPNLTILLKILAIAVPLDVIRTIFLSTMTGFQKIKYTVYSREILENVSKLILTIILLILGFGLMGAVSAYVIAILLSLILSFYFLEKKVFSFSKLKDKLVRYNSELLNYSWPLLFVGILVYVMTWTDTFMIGYFKTTSDVGIYNAAVPTALLLYVIPVAFMTLFFPVITTAYAKDDKQTFYSIYKTITKWIFMINLIILIIFIIFSKQIIQIIFGADYTAAWIPLILLSIGNFIYFLFRGTERILLVINRTRLVFLNFLIGGILNIALNYFLIPKYGINGAALATASSFIVISIVLFIQSLVLTKINPFKKVYLKIILSSLIAVSLIYFLKEYLKLNIFILILLTVLFIIFYLFMLLITKSFDKEDIMIIEFIQEKLRIRLPFIERIIKRFL